MPQHAARSLVWASAIGLCTCHLTPSSCSCPPGPQVASCASGAPLAAAQSEVDVQSATALNAPGPTAQPAYQLSHSIALNAPAAAAQPTNQPSHTASPHTHSHACSFSNIRARIPFEDLPYPGPVVALCQDIAIARASGLLAAEERLFWKLIGERCLSRVAHAVVADFCIALWHMVLLLDPDPACGCFEP